MIAAFIKTAKIPPQDLQYLQNLHHTHTSKNITQRRGDTAVDNTQLLTKIDFKNTNLKEAIRPFFLRSNTCNYTNTYDCKTSWIPRHNRQRTTTNITIQRKSFSTIITCTTQLLMKNTTFSEIVLYDISDIVTRSAKVFGINFLVWSHLRT